MKYRKRPIVVDAIQYRREENIGKCIEFCGNDNIKYNARDNEYYISTLEGDMKLIKGDYIIQGVRGEYYPCKPDIFKATYEEVEK